MITLRMWVAGLLNSVHTGMQLPVTTQDVSPEVVPGGGAFGSSLACSQADLVTAEDGLGFGLGASVAPPPR